MWVENMFDNTRNAVARSIDSIVHFTVTKVSLLPLNTAYLLSSVVLQALYKPRIL